MSILFGIRDFYHKFGYVRAWREATYVVKVSDLPDGAPAVRPRKVASPCREDIARMYNREHATCTGTAVRPTYRGRRRDKARTIHTWTDRRGRLRGYLVLRQRRGRLECQETGGSVEQALRVLARVARRKGIAEVHFPSLPYDTPLARRLRRGNCRLEMSYVRSGGAMVRTLNLNTTLEKIAPELTRRLKASHMADWKGRLTIADGRQRLTLGIERSRVRAVPAASTRHSLRGRREVAQLLLGSDEPGEVIEAGRMKLSGDAARLVAVLFPNQHPTLRMLDRF
jgi:hypothetical protein